jgi:hypothetical protein
LNHSGNRYYGLFALLFQVVHRWPMAKNKMPIRDFTATLTGSGSNTFYRY